MSLTQKRLYAAVVDPRGEFLLQAQRLVWSLTHLAGVDAEDVILHIAGDCDFQARKSIDRTGARVRVVPRHPSHAWCNKLQQLDSLQEEPCDDIVLLDCDMVVIEQPPTSEAILARQVDQGNPPLPLLAGIFTAAGLRYEQALTAFSGEFTVRGNANGGLYVIPQRHFKALAGAWQHWTKWCLERRTQFGDYWMHVDQVSFALAIAERCLPFEILDGCYNFPTHLPLEVSHDCEPKVIHYHRAVDFQQRLLPVVGLPRVNTAIDVVNARWDVFYRKCFDNAAFWSGRYALQPELGSGLGSRGDVLLRKQQLLRQILAATGCASVLDVGGGDGSVIAPLRNRVRVLTIDVSAEARHHYLRNVPDATWRCHDISAAIPHESADLTVCLDVLIHMPTVDDYSAAVSHLCACEGALLLSGFDAPPLDTGPMTYFHEPLTTTLARMNRPGIPIDGYRELTVVWVPPVSREAHPRDIHGDTLRAVVPLVDDRVTLCEAIACARSATGFFPNQASRCLEYPWVIDQLAGREGLHVLEVGAGVSPLPLMLANRGHHVVTVDAHRVVRVPGDRGQWNEWGFLDYSRLDPRIRSIHGPYGAGVAGMPSDVFVSVSVIEHLPRHVRRNLLADARRDLHDAGMLLITVDLVPFSKSLWNYSEGRPVEEEEVHGTLDDLLHDICQAGFLMVATEVRTWLPGSRVGVAMLKALKNPDFAGAQELNLDIGGQLNRNDMSGIWKIVDLHDGADYRLNLESDPLPLASDTVDNVYSSHCLEHLEPSRLRTTFAEIHRVMKTGGRFRMVVPHFMKGVNLYLNHPERLAEPLMPRMNTNTPDTRMSRLAAWFYTETNPLNGTPGHKSAWDFELAKVYLSEAGFREIRECTLLDCHPVFARKDNPGYEAFSLYVECVK